MCKDVYCYIAPIQMPPYQPALAHDLQKHLPYFQRSIQAGDRWFISRKLDGVRCQAFRTPQGCETKSREGRVFTSLRALESLVAMHVLPGYVIDGEICVLNADGSESFKDAVSQIRRKNHQMERFCFCVFDVLTAQEFASGTSDLTLSQRHDRAAPFMNLLMAESTVTQRVEWIEQATYSEDVMAEWQLRSDTNKWEGLMLRKDSGYIGKRTHDLLKVKNFFTEEYKITNVVVGPMRVLDHTTHREREIETVMAVTISHKGNDVSVGSGFSVEQRAQMYKDQQGTIGKVIAVQYFEETQDKDGKLSLRFPTFKYWHGDRRDT
jgi:DNA ligase-1